MSDGGLFDDLLEPVQQRRRQSTASEIEVSALVAKAIASLATGATPAVRSRTCLRCESIADAARAAGEPIPPVAEAMRSTHRGFGYEAALCAACVDMEWSRRWQARYDRASGKAEGSTRSHAEMRRLTELAEKRQASGRRVHVSLPNAPARHPTYGAR
jgi:hypothetical protein